MFKLRNSRIYKLPFEVGDTVVRVTRPSSPTSDIQRGSQVKITGIEYKSTCTYMPVDVLDGKKQPPNQYCNVYGALYTVEGSNRQYSSDNFDKVNGMSNVLAIESSRPTLIREFKETVVDGKSTREYVGDYIAVDSMSAARVYTTNAISDSIRKDNTYRKFAIFVEQSVAQAKKPEIEFA